jgi:peroxiredoxin-like protein
MRPAYVPRGKERRVVETKEQVYRVRGSWDGDLHSGKGLIQSERGTFETMFTVPRSFGGPGGAANPEEIFLASACACYLVTLAMIAEKLKLPVRNLTCTAEGKVIPDQQDGYHFSEITLRPHFEMEGDEVQYEETIARAVTLAEHRCIISRAVKGTVRYEIEHTVGATT